MYCFYKVCVGMFYWFPPAPISRSKNRRTCFTPALVLDVVAGEKIEEAVYQNVSADMASNRWKFKNISRIQFIICVWQMSQQRVQLVPRMSALFCLINQIRKKSTSCCSMQMKLHFRLVNLLLRQTILALTFANHALSVCYKLFLCF